MITKLLIANRGEIARRIMRTAAEMGIHSVAVFADPDAEAPFVADADEAIALYGISAKETYLDTGKILGAAQRTGADAIHPGYGFLSENAAFAQAVIDAGLVWVGPSPAVIAKMGDKLAAKRLMAEAGVPCLASVELDESDGTDLAKAISATGLPALVKASAGGGGKGMRVVSDVSEARDAVAGARREALAAFGDGTLFLERYVTGSRHVEIQILGDAHGNLVHCFERECSIQRRHQKIIEEAPSSAVDDALRDRLGRAAIAAASAIGYTSTGTVEFLLAPDGDFFFLEVNTRLQVEHPVTEAITGLDLVREQIRVAEGFPLAFGQGDLAINGHAIEARLYAEDPEHDFLPVTGTVLAFDPPAHPQVRVDSGIDRGSVVGSEFDPMLAKVVAHAPTRHEAAARLALALERTRIHGLVTNRDLLVAILRHPEFGSGNTTTSFIDDLGPARRRVPSSDELRSAAVSAALVEQLQRRRAAAALSTFPSGWRNSVMPPHRAEFSHDEVELVVDYRPRRDGGFEVQVGDDRVVARIADAGNDEYDIDIGGRRLRTSVHRHAPSGRAQRYWVHGPSGDVVLDEVARFPEPEVEVVPGGLMAPLPGKVIEVNTTVGDRVAEGQLLVIIEAMKMEHRVVAPHAGTITEFHASVGNQVSRGDLLVVIDS